MAEAELRNMIMNFRVTDLQLLLQFAGRNKSGKKQDLQSRALDLLKLKSHAAEMKIREIDTRRYHPPAIPFEAHRLPQASYQHPKPFPAPRYPTHAEVRLRELSFYDVLHVLLRPTMLVVDATDRFQESAFSFTLTPQQATDLAMSRLPGGAFDCQILLRFCVLDTSCEQEDCFPSGLTVKVNTKPVQLPAAVPAHRPGVEPKRPSRPVDITSLSKLSPVVQNHVSVSWASSCGRAFCVAMCVARRLASHTLLQRLKSNGAQLPDVTTAMIRDKLQQEQDAEIASTNLRVSLLCPLTKMRMQLPCRAVTCSHVQCFDASSYIQMNEKKPKWICAVCDKTASFRSLLIDGLFLDIASKVSSECAEVEFDENGAWTPIMPKPKEAKKTEKKESVEVVDIDSDSESDDSNPPFSAPTLDIPESMPTPQSSSLSFDSPDISATPSVSTNPFFPTQCNLPFDPASMLLDESYSNYTMFPRMAPNASAVPSSSIAPYFSDPFGASVASAYPDPMSLVSNGLGMNPYAYDLSTYIDTSEIDPQIAKAFDKGHNGSRNVMS